MGRGGRGTRAVAGAAVAVAVLATIAPPRAGAEVAAVPPTITTSGTRFVDATGATVVLRGVNAHPSTTPSTVLSTGANFVRVYVRWSDLEPNAPIDGTHTWSSTALAQLDALVSGLRTAGVQVLLDLHQCGWSSYWASITSGCSAGVPAWYYADGRFPLTAAGRSQARGAWWVAEADRAKAAYLPFLQMVVARYSAYENVMGYELFNEPASGSLGSTTEATNAILAWQASVIPEVRALDPWRAILVMGRGGGEGIGTADLSILGDDPHLVLDWHDYYNGRVGTGLDAAGDEWVPTWSSTHMQDTTTYDGTVEQQWEVLRVPVSRSAAAGMPLLVGEWGVRRDAANADVYQSQMLALFEDLGLSWSRWVLSTSDTMGIRANSTTLNAAGVQLRDYLTGPTGTTANDLPPVAQPPTIEGSAIPGGVLTAAVDVWERRPYAYTYRWDRCLADTGCAPIDGATGAAYAVSPEDVGAQLQVTVDGRNLWGTSEAVTSAPTDPVVEGVPVNTVAPSIQGTPSVGAVLTGSAGTWTPTPTSVQIGWQRCSATCADTGVSGASYVVGDADIGARLQIVVVAYVGTTPSASVVSPQTATVPLPSPVNLTAPTITGTARLGMTLTGAPGTWSYVTSFAYQWQRCGTSCSAITGATYPTYSLTSNDVGKKLRLKVTGRNATGSVIAWSAKTASVTR